MNLHALRIFTRVARSGSVTRTAESLLISQPAVTAQLRKLEQEIGMKLITSKGRSIQLTEAGELLAGYSKRLFALEAEIETKMDDFSTGKRGSLRICSTQLPASTVLPRWIVKFKQKYPLVDVQLYKGNSDWTYQRLLDYSVHAAFVCREQQEEGVESYTLVDDELIFIVPRDHRFARKEVSLEELMREPFILREKGSATRGKVINLCEAANLNEPKSVIQIEGMSESIEAVKAGYGAALVSALAVKKDLHNGMLGRVFVEDVFIKHPIKLCTRSNEELSSATANFISLIKDELANT
ncbi:LysR family transcriptional regulator [Thalassobacillus sp. CUG 92003]|uniref:LysR family transcriptional regulator n=1 Tax=Thalassobacillus sp. CUG 92003 TaxID=2736641 RepID=UPI0015E74BE5|nr:LysR substrate-binding domain-containing protein [Thalassobacillus sp. CUG 92003]